MSDTTTAQADTPTPEAPERSGRRLRLPGLGRSSGGSPLFRNAYALMLNTGISAVLGLGFWLAAARYYSESAVGQGSAAIAAMKLLAGLTAVTLTGALARFIPVAGRGTGRLIFRTYAGSSVVVALAAGALPAHAGPLGFLVPLPARPAATAVGLRAGRRRLVGADAPGRGADRAAQRAVGAGRQHRVLGGEAGAAGGVRRGDPRPWASSSRGSRPSRCPCCRWAGWCSAGWCPGM